MRSLRAFAISLIFALIAYTASYAYLRGQYVQRWKKDGHDYVIFPESAMILYYFYRPAAIVDGALTGMRFHIGPHEE
jgi:hypothetical protein